MGISEDYGLLNEQRVLEELVRRKLPFQHRVRIGDYEVDFLVGKRILIEVDGFVHVLKDTITKDALKEELLTALGFILLRITAVEVKNKGFLREFGARVQTVYEKDLARNKTGIHEPLKHAIPQEELQSLKTQLNKEAKFRESLEKARPKKATNLRQDGSVELTDEELFLQAIANLKKSRRK